MGLTDKDTVNGIPIIEWLKDQEEEEHKKEALKVVTEDGDKHYLYQKPPVRYTVRGRSGKVRKLTRHEIAKEYGMKPLTKAQRMINAMCSFRRYSRFTLKDICAKSKIEFSDKSTSALMSTIWKHIGDDGAKVLKRANTTPYQYTIATDELDNNQIYDLYMKYARLSAQAKRQAKKESGVVSDKKKEQAEKFNEKMQEQNAITEDASTDKPEYSAIDLYKAMKGMKIKLDINIRFGFLKEGE